MAGAGVLSLVHCRQDRRVGPANGASALTSASNLDIDDRAARRIGIESGKRLTGLRLSLGAGLAALRVVLGDVGLQFGLSRAPAILNRRGLTGAIGSGRGCHAGWALLNKRYRQLRKSACRVDRHDRIFPSMLRRLGRTSAFTDHQTKSATIQQVLKQSIYLKFYLNIYK